MVECYCGFKQEVRNEARKNRFKNENENAIYSLSTRQMIQSFLRFLFCGLAELYLIHTHNIPSAGDGEEIDADAANAEYEELRRRSQMERKEYEESEQGEREGGGEREHRALDGMMRAREEAGLGGRRGRDERGRARGRQNRLLFVIMFLFLMYRFYCIGVFGWIARLLADLFG